LKKKRDTVSHEELIFSSMWQLEGLVVLLEKKGLITRQELLEEIKEAQIQAQRKKNEA
jgi:hypothetical protein